MRKLLLFFALLSSVLRLQYVAPAGFNKGASGGSPTFTHSQGAVGCAGASSPCNIVLTNNPATGDVIGCAVTSSTASAITSITSVKDSNSNSYTVTPLSPSTFLSGAGQVWLYYLIAPSNATKTITVTYTASNDTAAVWCDDFTVSGGTATFDTDARAETASGSSCNTPSITPAQSGELLYAALAPESSVTAPASGATLGVWTGSGGALTNNNMAEYTLSASSATAVNFTCSSSGGWSAMSMAFK
jgi:hypothetical protein